MKIIKDLAKGAIDANKKDTLATKISILLAVVLLGTVVLLLDSNRVGELQYILTYIGDYHVSLSEVDECLYDILEDNENIEKISYERHIPTEMDSVIIEKDANGSYDSLTILEGSKPQKANELLVPDRFLNKNQGLKIGSTITNKGKTYTIVGIYKDYDYSFEETGLFGYLEEPSKDQLFKGDFGILGKIWYKNPRDTYTETRKILDQVKIDEKQGIDTGRVFYNTEYLESKLIYPSGIFPPKSVLADGLLTYGWAILLALLFAVMIYGAFNVWNNRSLREIALLKSVGMTEKQVKKFVINKAMKISYLPIFLGTVLSILATNLLIYLFWLNNAISYKKYGEIFAEEVEIQAYRVIGPSFRPIIFILALAFLTVYLAALVPAKRSSRLNIIEGLNGLREEETSQGRSKIKGKIEKTLAKDYYKAYKKTYRTIITSIVISACVITLVLVSQAYRKVNQTYNSYEDPYNISAGIFSKNPIDENIFKEVGDLENIDEIHYFQEKSFKFYLKDNPDFISDDLKAGLEKGKKSEENLFVRIYALEDKDFNRLLEDQGLARDEKYLLVNKITEDNASPYSFRSYIPLAQDRVDRINLRYNAEGPKMEIPLGAYIDDLPLDLASYNKNAIYILTSMNELYKFIEDFGQDPGDPIYYYSIKIKTEDVENLGKEVSSTIGKYIPRSDYYVNSDFTSKAADEERIRNENLLNAGIQFVLLTIALSNAYNSFHGNLRARTRDFQLLETAGMTQGQIKKMVHGEASQVLVRSLLAYVFVFFLAVFVRAKRSPYPLAFGVKEIIIRINYLPIILVFGLIILGIFISIRSGIKKILAEDLSETLASI